MNWLQKMSQKEIFKRHSHNPILDTSLWPYAINSVFNPGAVRLSKNKDTVLLCRVEDRAGISHLCTASSYNGYNSWIIDKEPSLSVEPDEYPEEEWGIEDPRIVKIPELKKHAITYTGYSHDGPCICLVFTKDFQKFDKVGRILPSTDKNAAIFPERIDDKWAILHRPGKGGNIGIKISYSDDLLHWGNSKNVLEAGEGPAWDSYKIGIGPPPIKTDDGWLLIYHGVKEISSNLIYRIGLALLDLKDPSKCLKRYPEWLMSPTEPYEIEGDVNNVIFPCGYTLENDMVNLYYGAADSSICLAQAHLKDLLECVKK